MGRRICRDGGGEDIIYSLVKDLEMPYMGIESRRAVLFSRLRALARRRQQEDDEPPHRPVRKGPMYHRGSICAYKPALRRYLAQDQWHAQCGAMDWENGVKEAHTPLLSRPSKRKCFLVLHLFTGRRRRNDYDDAYETGRW